MALPADFWRNPQQLNIFRSKPCQRLLSDGVCQWKSRCQFSHCPEWPRRSPMKYKYSPELCPYVQVVSATKDGIIHMRNDCTSGLSCPRAHSLEEVMFHPNMFKTTMCEEYQISELDQSKKPRSKRGKCHRYYCPYAHGPQELRSTPLAPELVDQYLAAVDAFPSKECCNLCTTQRLVTAMPPRMRVENHISQMENAARMRQAAMLLQMASPLAPPSSVPRSLQFASAPPGLSQAGYSNDLPDAGSHDDPRRRSQTLDPTMMCRMEGLTTSVYKPPFRLPSQASMQPPAPRGSGKTVASSPPQAPRYHNHTGSAGPGASALPFRMPDEEVPQEASDPLTNMPCPAFVSYGLGPPALGNDSQAGQNSLFV